jgi:hypothetical protein
MMANVAIFVGWGSAVRGRERQALQVFNEVMPYDAQLQQRGEIESFEPVALEPHGGDFLGFCLVRGEREKLQRLRGSEDFLRFTNRGSAVVENFGIVTAFIGEELQHLFTDFPAQTPDLTQGT